MYFRFIKVNFPFTKGEGKRRKLSFPPTVDNDRPTFRSPRYSFIASYDAKNKLRSAVVASFQDKFKQVEIGSLCLCDGSKYRGKASSEFEVLASSFSLLSVLLRQHPEKSSLQKDGTLTRSKHFLNGLDLSCIEGEVEIEGETSKLVLKAGGRPRVGRRLDMPPTPDAAGNTISTGDTSSTTLSDMLKTPSSRCVKTHLPIKKVTTVTWIRLRRLRWSRNGENSSSTTLMKSVRGTGNHWPLFCPICMLLAMQRQRMCSMRSMKRFQSGEELREQLKIWLGRKPFQRMSRAIGCRIGSSCTKDGISGNTWQAVLNITKLGRTGVSLRTIFRKFS